VRKKQKASFEVPDSSVVGCGTVSTGKSDFRQENNIAYIFSIEQWKKLCLLFQPVITYFKIP
jgi:hypothetical protein